MHVIRFKIELTLFDKILIDTKQQFPVVSNFRLQPDICLFVYNMANDTYFHFIGY